MDSYTWTNGAGTGLWLAAGNWRNNRTGGGGIPGAGDYALIGGIGSSNAAHLPGRACRRLRFLRSSGQRQ
jgi:hypothetical protein